MDTGQWLRPAYYPVASDKDAWASVLREARAARQGVAVCDVSTLGKIDVQGKDAATFLDRLYTNTFSNLAIGRARYGLMLREDGIVFDDGTTSRLADDHYFVTTTTANAGPVMQHMQFYLQTVWPDLDVTLASVTDQHQGLTRADPKRRWGEGQGLDQPKGADDRCRMDVGAARLVVEADVAPDDRQFERETGLRHAIDRFRELPHDDRVLRVSEVQTVDDRFRRHPDTRQVRHALRHGGCGSRSRIEGAPARI